MADAFVILSEAFAAPHLALYVTDRSDGRMVRTATCKRSLRAVMGECPPTTRLIAFCSNTIVSADIIDRLAIQPYNIHPGPPQFPGVHPDAFAHAARARRYGATAHELTAAVDGGPIVATTEVRMPRSAQRVDYGNAGFTTGLDLFRFIVKFSVAFDSALPHLQGAAWGGRYNTLTDYHARFGDAPAHAPDMSAFAEAA